MFVYMKVRPKILFGLLKQSQRQIKMNSNINKAIELLEEAQKHLKEANLTDGVDCIDINYGIGWRIRLKSAAHRICYCQCCI